MWLGVGLGRLAGLVEVKVGDGLGVCLLAVEGLSGTLGLCGGGFTEGHRDREG